MFRKVTEVSGKAQERWRKPAYEQLKFYQDICQIRRFVYRVTERLVRTHPRLASQMRDAARSAKQNIREGYRRGSLGEFVHSVRISLGSLEELSGDMEDCRDDGVIRDEEFEEFSSLFQSATYLAGRYLQALYRMEREGAWKAPGGRLRNFGNVP